MLANAFRIAVKDLSLLWGDKMGLFFVLAFPLIMALFFGSIFGGGGGGTTEMGIAVVDLDGSEASHDFARLLDESNSLWVWSPTEPDTDVPVEVTEELARRKVRAGELTAYIVLPEGYGGDGPFAGFGAEIRVGIDPSRQAEAGYLRGLLMEASFRRFQDLFTNPDAMAEEIDKLITDVDEWNVDPAQKTVFKGFFGAWKDFLQKVDPDVYGQSPGNAGAADDQLLDAGTGAAEDENAVRGGFSPVTIEIEEVIREGSNPRSAFEISFPQAMMWAVIGTCATFAVTLVRERKEGTLLRLRVAPHPAGVILAGKAFACFSTCVGSLALLTVIGHLVFGMRIESYGLYALGICCTGVCFAGIMMAITTLGTTEEAVGGAGWGVLIIAAMLGGGMVPLLVMPQWMTSLSMLSPVRWAVFSLEGAVWRGLTFEQLLPAYAVLLGVGIVAFALGVWVFRWREG